MANNAALTYKDLMTDPASPIIDFYPPDFELDLNGKKQDWEAIVLIPFIDQKRLLETMRSISTARSLLI
jgi:5'-3' exoribonuclease 1